MSKIWIQIAGIMLFTLAIIIFFRDYMEEYPHGLAPIIMFLSGLFGAILYGGNIVFRAGKGIFLNGAYLMYRENDAIVIDGMFRKTIPISKIKLVDIFYPAGIKFEEGVSIHMYNGSKVELCTDMSDTPAKEIISRLNDVVLRVQNS